VHFEYGRDYLRAVLYREHAGRLALQRAATFEAKEHLRHAVRLLAKLPDGADRQQLELRLQIGVANVAALSDGFESDDAVAASRRAYELCRESAEGQEPLYA
jgi:predicted ATPase